MTGKQYTLRLDAQTYSSPGGRMEILHGVLIGGRGAETEVAISISGRSDVFPFDPRALVRVPDETVALVIDVDEASLTIGAPSIGYVEIPNIGSLNPTTGVDLADWCRALAKLIARGAVASVAVHR